MNLLIKISVRNLFRQKRRNILLGIGIAFGMTILILANAFAHGLSDILLNRIVKLMTGHILVLMQEKPGDNAWGIIRDKDRVMQLIEASIQGDKTISEGVSTQNFASGPSREVRALGNGASGMILVNGVTRDDLLAQELEVIAGRPEDIFEDAALENPIMLYESMAESLNVRLHDTIRVRFNTVYGQVQAAQFTVAAILKATNPFLSMTAITSFETLKPLLGLLPHETASLKVVINNLNDPQVVIAQARRLREALQPGAAGYHGQLSANGVTQAVIVAGIMPDEAALRQFAGQLHLIAGNMDALWVDVENALISDTLAQALGVRLGDPLTAEYETKFEGLSKPRAARVSGIFESNALLSGDMVFLHPQALYDTCIPMVPKTPVHLERDSVLFPLLVKEWTWLEETTDQDGRREKYEALDERDWHGRVADVNTMYELASDILSMESVLNMVTLVAVLVLFFIILIGVVNTLRMTIRERTREIGTTRAIGMQRSDVRLSFVLEVVFLALFASLAGIVASFAAMALLGLMTIQGDGMFTLFLVNHHLYFLPGWLDVVTNLAIILAIAAVTALLPANHAARLSVAAALRHVE